MRGDGPTAGVIRGEIMGTSLSSTGTSKERGGWKLIQYSLIEASKYAQGLFGSGRNEVHWWESTLQNSVAMLRAQCRCMTVSFGLVRSHEHGRQACGGAPVGDLAEQ